MPSRLFLVQAENSRTPGPWPGVTALSYGVLRLTGAPVPPPQFSLWTALALLMVFFVAALGEDLGWSGYAIDPLQ